MRLKVNYIKNHMTLKWAKESKFFRSFFSEFSIFFSFCIIFQDLFLLPIIYFSTFRHVFSHTLSFLVFCISLSFLVGSFGCLLLAFSYFFVIWYLLNNNSIVSNSRPLYNWSISCIFFSYRSYKKYYLLKRTEQQTPTEKTFTEVIQM